MKIRSLLSVSGRKAALAEFVDPTVPFTCAHWLPVPEAMDVPLLPFFQRDWLGRPEAEQQYLRGVPEAERVEAVIVLERYHQNQRNYGAMHARDWMLKHWGSPADVVTARDWHHAMGRWSTAMLNEAHAIEPALMAISKWFPSLKFTLLWVDPVIYAAFRAVFCDGKCFEHVGWDSRSPEGEVVRHQVQG